MLCWTRAASTTAYVGMDDVNALLKETDNGDRFRFADQFHQLVISPTTCVHQEVVVLYHSLEQGQQDWCGSNQKLCRDAVVI